MDCVVPWFNGVVCDLSIQFGRWGRPAPDFSGWPVDILWRFHVTRALGGVGGG